MVQWTQGDMSQSPEASEQLHVSQAQWADVKAKERVQLPGVRDGNTIKASYLCLIGRSKKDRFRKRKELCQAFQDLHGNNNPAHHSGRLLPTEGMKEICHRGYALPMVGLVTA